MKNLIIERIEGKYYICSDKEKKLFAIEMTEMPENTKIGDRITINNEGEIEKQ